MANLTQANLRPSHPKPFQKGLGALERRVEQRSICKPCSLSEIPRHELAAAGHRVDVDLRCTLVGDDSQDACDPRSLLGSLRSAVPNTMKGTIGGDCSLGHIVKRNPNPFSLG